MSMEIGYRKALDVAIDCLRRFRRIPMPERLAAASALALHREAQKTADRNCSAKYRKALREKATA
jgi:hypothetical protein